MASGAAAASAAAPVVAPLGSKGAWSPAGTAGAVVLALLLVATYHRAAATLWHTWTTNDDYSHGPLVPLVAIAMAWSARARLAAHPARGDARGLGLVALASALELAGLRADVLALEGWSFVTMVLGLVWTFFGAGIARVLLVPIAYLGFMLPFPPLLMNQIAYGLKEITVVLSTAVAEALGAQFQRNGMTLHLASGELRVENPCSGLRSLLALLATASAFAWFQPGGAWRRRLLVLAGVPIAVVGNALRLTLLILVAHYGTMKQATGWLHDVSGYLLYAGAIAFLFVLRRWLAPERREPARAAA